MSEAATSRARSALRRINFYSSSLRSLTFFFSNERPSAINLTTGTRLVKIHFTSLAQASVMMSCDRLLMMTLLLRFVFLFPPLLLPSCITMSRSLDGRSRPVSHEPKVLITTSLLLLLCTERKARGATIQYGERSE